MNVPGTVIPIEKSTGPGGEGFLNGIFAATSGLMLSQVREITGLDAPALQNWVKRGFVPPPEGKRYGIDQVARILVINMLRDVMQLEKIAFLLSYLNGNLLDTSDDIIPESVLYSYICRIRYACGGALSEKDVEKAIESCTGDYVEKIPGAAQKLHRALRIILLSLKSAQLKKEAENLLATLR
ncbi:MAG: DUF1836 domain-containing protein [Clostridiaceae bacterium]|nr:DUF1836 domain-containing protein [Eubacteriales bacterium]